MGPGQEFFEKKSDCSRLCAKSESKLGRLPTFEDLPQAHEMDLIHLRPGIQLYCTSNMPLQTGNCAEVL